MNPVRHSAFKKKNWRPVAFIFYATAMQKENIGIFF